MQARLKPPRWERGLYLEPPQHAAVFCVDEKTAIQWLDRGLFVDAEHGRMLRRLKVQTAFQAVRFQSGLHQDALHRYFFHHLPGDLVFCSEGHLVDEFVDAILPEMHFLFKYFANDDRIAGSSNRSVLERIS